jgi:hypothetical protein
MLGDSFHRLQADELDAEWDRLVTQGRCVDTTLENIVYELNATITPANSGARSRIRRQLFAPRFAESQEMRPASSLSSLLKPVKRLPLPRRTAARRWWSSPIATLEIFAACLIISVLAFGISAYPQNNNRGSEHQLLTAAEGTPARSSPIDWYQDHWSELNQMRAAVQPTRTSWGGEIGHGKIRMTLVEVYLPIGGDASGRYSGIVLANIVHGSIELTSDSSTPSTLSAGEAVSRTVDETFSLRNLGSEIAYVVLGYVIQDEAIPSPTSTPIPDSSSMNYYGSFLGNATLDLRSDSTRVTLEILDETTIDRDVQNTSTELLVNQLGTVSLMLGKGPAEVRGTGLDVTSDDYRDGGGYSPMAPGSIVTFGVAGANILVQPGASYTLTAPPDIQVLAISLSID